MALPDTDNKKQDSSSLENPTICRDLLWANPHIHADTIKRCEILACGLPKPKTKTGHPNFPARSLNQNVEPFTQKLQIQGVAQTTLPQQRSVGTVRLAQRRNFTAYLSCAVLATNRSTNGQRTSTESSHRLCVEHQTRKKINAHLTMNVDT